MRYVVDRRGGGARGVLQEEQDEKEENFKQAWTNKREMRQASSTPQLYAVRDTEAKSGGLRNVREHVQ